MDPNPKPVISPETPAADVLEHALFGDDTAPGAEESPAAEPSEEPAAEAPSGEPEPEAEPASPVIDPPASWNAADKAEFAKLPPNVQKTIAERESQRDAGLARKLEEAASERKAAEADRQAAQQSRAQLVHQSQVALASLYPELQQYQSVDWVTLADTDPALCQKLTKQKEAVEAKIRWAEATIKATNDQQIAEQQARRQQMLLTEKERFTAKYPQYAAPEKARKFAENAEKYLASEGFNAGEIARLSETLFSDHRMLTMLHKNMDAAAKQRSLAAAQDKKGKPVPSLQRAGQVIESDEGAAKTQAALMNRLKKTGSERDAAKFLETII